MASLYERENCVGVRQWWILYIAELQSPFHFPFPAKFIIGRICDRPLANIRYIGKICPGYSAKKYKPRSFGIFPTYENQLRPCTLIRHKNRAFRVRSLNWRNQLKTPALRFSVNEKQFENDCLAMIVWFFLPEFSHKTKTKLPLIVAFWISPA